MQLGASHLSDRQKSSRDEILVAAAEAFLERGYAATSIDDIALRLGSTKGRVYHYFRAKGDVFLAIHQRSMEMSFAAVRPVAESEAAPSERLRGMVHAHALMIMQDLGFMRLGVQYAEMNLVSEGRTRKNAVDEVYRLRRDYEDLFVRVIKDGIASGEFRPVDPRLAAKAALGSLNWMSMWYRPGRNDRQTIARQMADFVVAGVSA